ncbi:hypothetical protein EMGBD1_16260 [Anaerolineaceae bacterium]|nr:hypothetical protein EMGBD1_16260 [Anaerolineaceae bacterium]
MAWLLVACLLLTLVATPGVAQAATLAAHLRIVLAPACAHAHSVERALLLIAPPIALMSALWFYYAGVITTGRISSTGPDIKQCGF